MPMASIPHAQGEQREHDGGSVRADAALALRDATERREQFPGNETAKSA